MTPTERNLLLRVARRMEEQANKAYSDNASADVKAAKRRRDSELGDARDLRDLAKRETAIAPCPQTASEPSGDKSA